MVNPVHGNNSSMITYQIESYDEILDEINEIISDHYIETELYSTQIPLDPDYNMYSAGNEAGIIQFYTARDDLNLIGYVIVMLANKPHAKNCLYALCDMVYVHPEYRHTGVAPETTSVRRARSEESRGGGVRSLYEDSSSLQNFDESSELRRS